MALLEKELASAPTPENWQEAINKLYGDVTRWAREWRRQDNLAESTGIRRDSIDADDGVHSYTTQTLTVDAPPRPQRLAPKEEIVFEPKVLNPEAAVGFVDFYIWPAHYRVRLVYSFREQSWTIQTDSGLYWPHAWGQDTFVEIAEGFLQA